MFKDCPLGQRRPPGRPRLAAAALCRQTQFTSLLEDLEELVKEDANEEDVTFLHNPHSPTANSNSTGVNFDFNLSNSHQSFSTTKTFSTLTNVNLSFSRSS